jgi:hypothetical protein
VLSTLGVREGPARGLLLMLLTVAGGLVAAHLAHFTVGRPGDHGFRLGLERGFGELYFVILTVWAVGLLVLLAVRERSGVLAAWAVAFCVLFVDDWFTVHERLGADIGRRIGTVYHVGELLLHLRSRGTARAASAVLVGLALGLFVCGVVVDFLHGTVTGAALDPYVTVVEDGGEIIVMCAVVAFLFAVAFVGHLPRVGPRWGAMLGVPPGLRAAPSR